MANNTSANYFSQPAGGGTDNVLNLDGTWKIGGTAVTATADDINNMLSTDVTASAAELNTIDGVNTAGYVVAAPVAGKLIAAGAHSTTAGEAVANTLTIATGLTTVATVQVMVLDATNNVVTADADVTFTGGNLVVADGSTYNTVEGQVIHWFAYGV
jgi:hypothetical protein